MKKKDLETLCPANRQEWRQWLEAHHGSKQSVLLIYYKKKTNLPTVLYSEAVDEALCFGWIDSTRTSLGDDQFMQLFCRRKPKSVWSKINKGKVQRLTEEGLMAAAGHACIENARQNGSWAILDEVEELKVPKDLAKAFRSWPGSKKYFMSLSRSVKKAILQWLVLARRAETRQRRITEIAELAGQKMRPKQFR